MCGIAGVCRFDRRSVSLDLLRSMTDAIAHRGPDGEGHHTDGPVGLGHRRLAILDLTESGRQPMTTDDGRHTITYNGEVYNHEELRVELEALGHTFHSTTDTEVVLHAYAEWGPDSVRRLNGMFAFGIWDSHEGRLFLARDRYGIKPLYHHVDPARIAFGSEIKALLEDPGVEAEVDPVALREYFTFQNVYSDRTLFAGVRMLPAGHTLTVDAATGTTTQERYWDFDLSERARPEAMDRVDCTERLRGLFATAVRRQLMSDVPLGAHLSGGIDSGSIVAAATRFVPRIKSFTGGFDVSQAYGFEASFDERSVAEAMASRFGTEHYQTVLSAVDMRHVFPELVWHLEDLRAGMSWQNYYVDRLASRFVKVALSGTGGDELFAGYPWRYRQTVAEDEDGFLERTYAYWQRIVPEAEHAGFFHDEVMKETEGYSPYGSVASVFENAPGHAEEWSQLDKALYFDLKTFLHGLFVVQDKIGMAHSLETRVPLMDNDLVDFALRVPSEYKLGQDDQGIQVDENVPGAKGIYFRSSNEGKRIFREAMQGLVPDDVLERKKQGFSPPDESWYRSASFGYLKELLLAPDAMCHRYIRADAIERALVEHESGEHNHRLLIWSLMCFEWWCQVFLPKKETQQVAARVPAQRPRRRSGKAAARPSPTLPRRAVPRPRAVTLAGALDPAPSPVRPPALPGPGAARAGTRAAPVGLAGDPSSRRSVEREGTGHERV